jgi:hypothetical protein
LDWYLLIVEILKSRFLYCDAVVSGACAIRRVVDEVVIFAGMECLIADAYKFAGMECLIADAYKFLMRESRGRI